MIKVVLSHDIDRIDKSYQYFTKTLRALLQGDFNLFIKRLLSISSKTPYWGFDHIIEIENKYSVKSTHFFLSESIPFMLFKPSSWKLSLGRYKIMDKRIVEIMRYLDNNGWEIGVHGSYRSYDSIELLTQEKKEIEEIIGHPVYGIRQHYLNLSENTWRLQNKAGFMYDSTWGHTRDIGVKEGRIVPFFPLSDNKNFCVIPLTIMDFPFVNIANKWERFEKIVEEIEQKNAFLVINFHNNNYDEVDFPHVKATYIELIERLKSRDAQFLTMQEAYKKIVSDLR